MPRDYISAQDITGLKARYQPGRSHLESLGENSLPYSFFVVGRIEFFAVVRLKSLFP